MLESVVALNPMAVWLETYGNLPVNTRNFDAAEMSSATVRWYNSEPQYERNGLGFNEQMFCLIEKLKEKAQSLDESYGPDTAEAFNNFYEAFTSPRTADNPSIYKDMYNEYFAKVKKYLEEVLYLLEVPSPDASFNETKKNVLKDLRTEAFRSCAPGLPSHLENLKDRLITQENAVVWLANLRRFIVEQMAESYFKANNVPASFGIHVVARFRQYANVVNLRISGNTTHDVFAKEYLKSSRMQNVFKAGFDSRYTLDVILDCVTENARILLSRMDGELNPDPNGWINVARTPVGRENLTLVNKAASNFLFALELAPQGRTPEDMSVSDLFEYSDDFLKVRIIPEIRTELKTFIQKRLKFPVPYVSSPTVIGEENWQEKEDTSIEKLEKFVAKHSLKLLQVLRSVLIFPFRPFARILPARTIRALVAIESIALTIFKFSHFLMTKPTLIVLSALSEFGFFLSFEWLRFLSKFFRKHLAFLPKSFTLLLKLVLGSTLASAEQILSLVLKLTYWKNNVQFIGSLVLSLFNSVRLATFLSALQSHTLSMVGRILTGYTVPIFLFMQAIFWSVHIFRWNQGERFIVNDQQREEGALGQIDHVSYLKSMLFNVRSFFSYNFALGRIAAVGGSNWYEWYKNEIEQVYRPQQNVVVAQENAPDQNGVFMQELEDLDPDLDLEELDHILDGRPILNLFQRHPANQEPQNPNHRRPGRNRVAFG